MKKLKARAIFISDVHLGSRSCKAEELLDFLDNIECDTLYLVGDILDVWKLRRRIYWPLKHQKVVTKIFKLAKSDVDVIFIPGNHDEVFRPHNDTEVSGIKIKNQYLHLTVRGKKYLVTHGDQFDHVVIHHKWVAKLGGVAYEYLLQLNRLINRCRKLCRLPYWSLAKYLKLNAKKITGILERFTETLVEHAKNRGFDGVICGHIHDANILQTQHGEYINCGDWVDSCTAIYEDHDGKIKLFVYEQKAL